MVKKPNLYLNVAILLMISGQNSALHAQSRLSEPFFHTLHKVDAKDTLSHERAPTLSTQVALEDEVSLQKPSATVLPLADAEGRGGQYSENPFSEVPSSFISLGNHHPTYGIVVEKIPHRLTVFKLQEDGNYSIVKTYKAITGKKTGDKKFSGDNRTPEGIYFVVGQKSSNELLKRWGKSASKYGPHAFVLDYPNIFDRRLHKTGFGIWIHGVEKETRILTPFDTQGCVALTNSDVLDISKYISAFETPVVIVDQMHTTPLASIENEREKVLGTLEHWRRSWESSDINAYTSYYSDNFYSLGRSKNQWENFKKMLARRRDNSIQVQISEPKILAFKNQLLVEFLQKYSSKEKTDFGRKFLYLQPRR